MFGSVGAWLQQATTTAAQTISETSSTLVEQSGLHDLVTALSAEVTELREEVAQALHDDVSDTEDKSNEATTANAPNADDDNNNDSSSSSKKQSGATTSPMTLTTTSTSAQDAAAQRTVCDGDSTTTTTADVTTLRLCDVCTPPPQWSASAEAWQWLLAAAFSDDDTCILDPARIVRDAVRWGDVCAALSPPHDEAEHKDEGDDTAAVTTRNRSSSSSSDTPCQNVCVCVATLARMATTASTRCVPHAELVTWLTSQPALHATYTRVMPRYVSDDAYWWTVYWKCTCYRVCSAPAQLLRVMQLLAAPLTTSPHDDSNNNECRSEATAGGADAVLTAAPTTSYWQRIADESHAMLQQHARLRALERQVRTAMTLANESAATLRRHMTATPPQAASPHAAATATADATTTRRLLLLLPSLRESCNFHSYKLARLLAQLCEQQEQLRGTSLDQYTGVLFAQLMQTRTSLADVLHMASSVATSDAATAAAASASASASAAATATRDTHDNVDSAAHDVAAVTATATATMATAHDDSDGAVHELTANSSSNNNNDDNNNNGDNDASFVATMPWENDDDDDEGVAAV